MTSGAAQRRLSRAPELASLASIGTAALVAVAVGAAVGFADVPAAMLTLGTLLPVAAHVRWVGVRRALSEPSPATVILLFYLSVFPQRGLAIATSDFTKIKFAVGATRADLAATLMLASLCTTLLIEAYHRVHRNERPVAWTKTMRGQPLHFETLAAILGALALTGLVLTVVQNGGIGGAQEVFLGHSKFSAAEAKSAATSLVATVAIPAVWCAAGAVFD